MKLWILFPSEGAFYLGMGRELYEMEKDYRSFCRSAERKLKLPLHSGVFYQQSPFPVHLPDRQGAVMVLSLANFQHFRKNYPQAPELLLCGRGMGLLSALVAAEALTLEAAVGRLRGKPLHARHVKTPKLPVYSLSHSFHIDDMVELTEKEQILKAVETALSEQEAWALPLEYPCLDIGPGREAFDALHEKVISRLDEPGDPQYIWASFQCKRLWNKDYCAKRLFGIMVSTPNENDACDGVRLDAQEKEMRELLKPLFAQEPESISEEAFTRCAELLRESFAEKHTSSEEIALRFRLLAQETLIFLPAEVQKGD